MSFLITFSVFASSNESSFSVDVGSDEQGNKSSLIAVDLSLDSVKNIMFGAGRTNVPVGAETVVNNFLYFGLSKKISDD